MFDPPKPSIAVGFVTDPQGRLLLTWNDKWQAFTIPMTKIDTEPPAETVAQAAVRAVSEVLGVPTRAIPGKQKDIGVMRALQKSERDAQIKDYQYQVAQIEIHPDFASITPTHHPSIWVDVSKLQRGEYQPVSPSVERVLQNCIEWGWIK